MGHSFLSSISRHIPSYNTAYIMLKTLIFALLVLSAVALPYGSKKAKPVHVPKHPVLAPVDDHPVEVAVEVVVEVAAEEEPVVEDDPTADEYHPADEEPEALEEPEEPTAEEEVAAPEEHPVEEE